MMVTKFVTSLNEFIINTVIIFLYRVIPIGCSVLADATRTFRT